MVNLFDGSFKASIDDIKAQGFIPDVIVIDTLGRAMGGAKETTEDFNTIFLYIDEMMQDYLPGLTLVVVGHTRKADLIFRGPQVIPGDCDNIIYVERIGKELKTNVTCEFSRNASEFSNFGVTFGPRDVPTDEGPQNFLTVNGLTPAFDAKAADKTTDKNEDEELAFKTLLGLYRGEHMDPADGLVPSHQGRPGRQARQHHLQRHNQKPGQKGTRPGQCRRVVSGCIRTGGTGFLLRG